MTKCSKDGSGITEQVIVWNSHSLSYRTPSLVFLKFFFYLGSFPTAGTVIPTLSRRRWEVASLAAIRRLVTSQRTSHMKQQKNVAKGVVISNTKFSYQHRTYLILVHVTSNVFSCSILPKSANIRCVRARQRGLLPGGRVASVYLDPWLIQREQELRRVTFCYR